MTAHGYHIHLAVNSPFMLNNPESLSAMAKVGDIKKDTGYEYNPCSGSTPKDTQETEHPHNTEKCPS